MGDDNTGADAPQTPVTPTDDNTSTPPAPGPMPVGGTEDPVDTTKGAVPGTPPAENPVTPVEPNAPAEPAA